MRDVENGNLLVLSSKLDCLLEVGEDSDGIKIETPRFIIQPPANLLVVHHRMLKHLFQPLVSEAVLRVEVSD